MIEESVAYLAGRQIARREPLYSANRFARHMGDIPAAEVTTEHLDQLRICLQAVNLSPRTIETTIADLITVITAMTGTAPKSGRRIAAPRPRPQPVPLETINAIWPECSPSLQAWIAFAYWTGLRMSDTMRWLCEHKAKSFSSVITVIASKTRKEHCYPFPAWLAEIITNGPYRFRTVSDFAKRAIRCEINAACERASVGVVLPKHFRQRGVTEWTRANATAGAIIHGCGLGVLSHYLDPLSVLESAAPRVRLPACFGACTTEDSEANLLSSFRRLDPAAQGLIAGTAERLAAG